MDFTDLRNAVERNRDEGVRAVVALAFYDAFRMAYPSERKRRRHHRDRTDHRETRRLMDNRWSATDRHGKC